MSKSLFNLKANYKPAGDQPAAIEKLLKGLAGGSDYQTLLGVTGSGKTFTMANVIAAGDRPVLVMAPNKALAAQLYREYKNYFPNNSVNYFVSYYDYYQPEAYMPVSDTYIEKEAMINDEIDRLRHQATSALLTRRDVIVVASVSCIYNLGLPVDYKKFALQLSLGQALTRQELISQLIKLQFERTPGELERGKFRVRGDVIEVMPIADELVYRLELEGEKLRKIYVLDQLTRKIIEQSQAVIIWPVKHFVATNPRLKQAVVSIRAELKDRLKYFKRAGLWLEAERLERRTNYDMEMLNSLGFCHGIENYSLHLTGKTKGEAPDTLLSYFPSRKGRADWLTIMDESHIGLTQVKGMYAGDRARKETLIEHGWRLPSALDNRPLKFDEFTNKLGQVIFTSATPSDREIELSSQVAEQVVRPTGLVDPPIEIRPVFNEKTNYSQIDDIVIEIKKEIGAGRRIIVNTLTKLQAEDLHAYLSKAGIGSNFLHSDIKTIARTDILMNFRKGKFDVLVGVNLLREGLDLPEVGLVAILDADREGFLRSQRSLMQIMGRAARNVSGKIILYADNMTGSIKWSVREVERRRRKQLAYNKKHGIIPKTINKKIEDWLEAEAR